MNVLLVYESEPRNAATLARLGEVKLREVRSLMQLKRAMENQTAQIVAIEVTSAANLPAVANLIRTMKRKARNLAVIAMPRDNELATSTHAWLYEAGADVIFESILDRQSARRLIQRAASRRVDVDRESDVPFRQQVEHRLPWKRFAT